jgi:hypothetical protein
MGGRVNSFAEALPLSLPIEEAKYVKSEWSLKQMFELLKQMF